MTDGQPSAIPARIPEAPAEAGAARLEEIRRRLVGLAVRLLWNRDDAEEIVQDAFRLALTRGLSPGDSAVAGWMMRTVANLALNLRRRRRPEPLADWADPIDSATPAERSERGEALERLRAAIEQLPPRQRLAIVLRTMQQLEYDEIADVMELTPAAVRAHVHFARHALAERLVGPRRKGEKP
jgi:RNA polymerase sigma-70 factor (ECF subfamily)